MDNRKSWLFSRLTPLVVLLLTLGPFALPFVWLHPHLSGRKKAIITAIVVLATYALSLLLLSSFDFLQRYYQGSL